MLPSPEQFAQLSVTEKERLLQAYGNSAEFDPVVFDQYYSAYQGASSGVSHRKVAEELVSDQNFSKLSTPGGGTIRSGELDAEAARQADAALGGTAANPDLDKDGKVSQDERDALKAAADKAIAKKTAEAVNAGQISADQQGAAADELAGMAGLSVSPVPSWIKSELGGKLPDDQLISKMIMNWNEANPGDTVRSSEELYSKMKYASPDNQEVMGSAMFGRDPIVKYSFKVRGNDGTDKFVDLSAEQYAIATQTFGADKGQLGMVVRQAAKIGLDDGGNGIGWQMLAALNKATRNQLDVATTKGGDEIRGPGNQIKLSGVTQTNNLALKFKEGMKAFNNDPALAYLYSLDPVLAYKLGTASYDKKAGFSITNEDRRRANQLFIQGGLGDGGATLGKLGYSTFKSTFSELADGGYFADLVAKAAGAAGGAERTRVAPDPEAVKQSVKDMWRALYRRDPTEQELAGFQGQLAGMVKNTPLDQEVDVSAKLRAYAEGNPEYQQLYGKKPTGMSEEEYQRQFLAGAADVIGNAAPDEASIRAGMQTGDYQTTVGSAFGSQAGWNNSRLRGRLAEAAQLVNRNT